MKITMKLCLILSGGLLSAGSVLNAQEIGISDTTIEACEGFLVDTGLSAADYGANEDIIMTICPEAPETIVTLNFVLASFGSGDMLRIYDGVDTDGSLLGTYVEFDAQGLEIFASEDNPGGCLTLHWTSDDQNNGNFVIEMSCGYPCDRPFAIVSSGEPVPHLACPGEVITFDASESTVASDFNIISWDWDFGDETSSNEGAVVTHVFEEPGAYKVQLNIADDNVTDDEPDGCTNNNLIDHLVLISTEPDWSGTSVDATVCSGQLFPLEGMVTGVTYDSEPTADFGGGLFIPDDQSECFSAELTFTSFSPLQIVEDVSTDIVDLFINFEHSYMGDLTITFICPNGQSVVVHDQGGGGTQLGIPDQLDGTGPGMGWDYYWSPLSTNGTWADNAGGTLAAGTYETGQPLELLEGCPLNGTWEVEVCDSWGQDDGYIFDWTVHFNPDLYPEPVVFTPVFGMECDSTSWEGLNIYDESEDCNDITVIATESASYTYTATNNFGCTYSTDVSLNVVPGPEVVIDTPEGFCGSPVSLSGNVTNLDPAYTYNYEWSPADLVSGGGSEVTVDGLSQDTIMTLTVSVTGGDLDNCEVEQNVEVDFVPEPTAVDFSGAICPDEEFDLVALNFVLEGTSQDDYSYEWTDMNDPTNTILDSLSAVYQINGAGDYQVVVTMLAPCTWSTISTFTVEDDVCDLTIPNVISPNGSGQWDNMNDAFLIGGLDGDRYKGSTIRIYNRWGKLMYSSNDFGKSAGWRPEPEDATEGTYFYILGIARTNSVLTIIDIDGPITDDGEGYKYMNGSFTLVRD
jgi:subtilisin-like proprotein convertase family protein